MSKFVILHKRRHFDSVMLYNESDLNKHLQHLRKKVSLANTIHHSSFIYNYLKKLNLCKFYSNRVIKHLMSILISIFISGYHGKTTDFAKNSSCHRTTIAHFLNSGKWDDSITFRYLKTFCYRDYLFRSSTHRKACFLNCRRYYSFKDKAFVTGFTSY